MHVFGGSHGRRKKAGNLWALFQTHRGELLWHLKTGTPFGVLTKKSRLKRGKMHYLLDFYPFMAVSSIMMY